MRFTLPCPHCHERPTSLDMHLRFECPKLFGRSRYVGPVAIQTELPLLPPLTAELQAVVDKFFKDLDNNRLTF